MKERLDILLVNKGHFASREKAKAAIMAGDVQVDGLQVTKAGTSVPLDADITVKEKLAYVGRGGLKLEKALQEFGPDLAECISMDIGASTGGFTDCMLQRGASRVYAVDVGYGQLDWKLRNDPRVVNMEKTNIRHLDPEIFPEKLDFISIDVSFISLKLVFPVASALLKERGKLVCLVKPQFEAGRGQVGKNGIVRDRKVHLQVLEAVESYGRRSGLCMTGLTFSPVTGAKGNIEYLMCLEKDSRLTEYNAEDSADDKTGKSETGGADPEGEGRSPLNPEFFKMINSVVETAHGSLNSKDPASTEQE